MYFRRGYVLKIYSFLCLFVVVFGTDKALEILYYILKNILNTLLSTLEQYNNAKYMFF